MAMHRRVDIAIGQRLREQRLRRELTIRQLAAAVGATAEDVSQYEAGRKHMSAATLYTLAVTLGVPISYFFSDMRYEARDDPPDHVSMP